MNQKWNDSLASLAGKTVAVSGADGGLGQALCRELMASGANLLLLDRNQTKSAALAESLLSTYPTQSVRRVALDLADMTSVRTVCAALEADMPDILIFNAGIYSVPRYRTPEGYDNVFTVNFAAPYYMVNRLMPKMREKGTHVVAVGSIAHTYAKTDPADVDFHTRKRASLVYGNSKRYWMYALWGLFAGETRTTLAVVHPGISFTGITSHYPPLLFALIRKPMQWIFPKPARAARSLLYGTVAVPETGHWIGPRLFRVWGKPHVEAVHSADTAEQKRICENAQAVWRHLAADEVSVSPLT